MSAISTEIFNQKLLEVLLAHNKEFTEELIENNYNQTYFEITNNSQYGDLTTNFAMMHAKSLKMNPVKLGVILVNGFEIYLDELSNFQTKKISTKKAYHNNVLQAVERDFAFFFPQKVRAEEVIKLIKSINKQIMKKVTIFDVFEGNKLPEGTKSIAFKIILQPVEKTFTDNEIEKISDNIIDLISKNFEGKLRQ